MDWKAFQDDRRIRLSEALMETMPLAFTLNLASIVCGYDVVQPFCLQFFQIGMGHLYLSNFSPEPVRRFEVVSITLPSSPKNLQDVIQPDSIRVQLKLNHYVSQLTDHSKMYFFSVFSDPFALNEHDDTVTRSRMWRFTSNDNSSYAFDTSTGLFDCEAIIDEHPIEASACSKDILRSNPGLVQCPQLNTLYDEVDHLRTNGTLSFMSQFEDSPTEWLDCWNGEFCSRNPVDRFLKTIRDVDWIRRVFRVLTPVDTRLTATVNKSDRFKLNLFETWAAFNLSLSLLWDNHKAMKKKKKPYVISPLLSECSVIL
jgi:hypothetical protein